MMPSSKKKKISSNIKSGIKGIQTISCLHEENKYHCELTGRTQVHTGTSGRIVVDYVELRGGVSSNSPNGLEAAFQSARCKVRKEKIDDDLVEILACDELIKFTFHGEN